MWLRYQTNTVFDHALEKALCPLDLTVELWLKLSTFNIIKDEKMKAEDGEGEKGKQTEMKVNDQR